MMKHGFFTFHIVDESPWPLYMSFGLFSVMVASIDTLYFMEFNIVLFFSLIFSIMSFFGWTNNVVYESTFQGCHSISVISGLKMGFALFIISEVMFFLSFFWGIFYSSITPSVVLGGWPPVGLKTIDPLGVPLLGTMLLMSSGISITWSHNSTIEGSKVESIIALFLTIFLGLSFSVLQFLEYQESSFTMSDSVYGSLFYMSTGFHGLHVIVGSIFLIVCLIRVFKNHFSSLHHVGYEFAIWYWHFVDVVWLFLYICMYWWGW